MRLNEAHLGALTLVRNSNAPLRPEDEGMWLGQWLRSASSTSVERSLNKWARRSCNSRGSNILRNVDKNGHGLGACSSAPAEFTCNRIVTELCHETARC